ncbi:30S ribosomal protein S1 [Oceanobacillus locisalsi]|uniref:30S ribosomal protein S1 n=1 Tax=Oceanobacillus locisalsi TaxID=546107 RepID=A0ABW3NC85_9BACI
MSEENKDLQVLEVGTTVTGTVVKLEEKQVLVDIGYKTEGILPISELSTLHVESTTDVLSEGEEVTLKVKKIDDDEVVLSKKAVDAEQSWDELERKYEQGEAFETTVKEVVKGGLVVDVGVRGFIPASLVETYYVEDFSDYLDRTLKVKITDIDRSQNRVILSHRAIVEDEEKERKEKVLQSLNPGDVIDGVVQRITNFGVFVDLGGVDGLVHISQLAHEHVEKASDVVAEGDTMKVEVISVDLDSERISLSHKNTLPGPWAEVSEKIKPGATAEGVVKRLVSFGAFVELLPGVEGLVHISQIANRHIGTPQEVLEIGQTVTVKVLDVNEEEQRISLSMKELEQEQEEKDYKQYEKSEDQPGFQLGDVIGDQLDKYK